jgi:RNA polymerase sigma-70 factor (ECF subfamily)
VASIGLRKRDLAHDADWWRQWLARHGPALVLFARQWSANRADAEDAVQDGFLKFWTNRERAHDPVPYLYACVRTAAMDHGRGQRRRETRQRETARLDEASFEPALDRSERQARIESALAQLPGDQREVVVLKIWAELTFAQIGQTLGISPNTAASRYRLALARLGTELEQELAHD